MMSYVIKFLKVLSFIICEIAKIVVSLHFE